LVLPIDPPTQNYLVEWTFAGSKVSVVYNHTQGNPFAPILPLNEATNLTLKVYEETGELITYTDPEGVNYDCFTLTTKPHI
jgi:hypothetical protein